MSSDIKIAVFANKAENENLKDQYSYKIITKFISEHICVNVLFGEKTIEFKYQVKLGQIVHFVFNFITDLTDYDDFCDSLDYYVILFNSEDDKSIVNLKTVISYIKRVENYETKISYITGIYNNEQNKKINAEDIHKIIKNKKFKFNYTEITEDKIQKALEGLFIAMHEMLKDKKENPEEEEVEINKDYSNSNCSIM